MVCRWYIYSEWDYNPFITGGAPPCTYSRPWSSMRREWPKCHILFTELTCRNAKHMKRDFSGSEWNNNNLIIPYLIALIQIVAISFVLVIIYICYSDHYIQIYNCAQPRSSTHWRSQGQDAQLFLQRFRTHDCHDSWLQQQVHNGVCRRQWTTRWLDHPPSN